MRAGGKRKRIFPYIDLTGVLQPKCQDGNLKAVIMDLFSDWLSGLTEWHQMLSSFSALSLKMPEGKKKAQLDRHQRADLMRGSILWPGASQPCSVLILYRVKRGDAFFFLFKLEGWGNPDEGSFLSVLYYNLNSIQLSELNQSTSMHSREYYE